MCHLLLSPGLVSHRAEQEAGKVYIPLYTVPTLDNWELVMHRIAMIR